MKKIEYDKQKIDFLLKSNNSNELWYHNIYNVRKIGISYNLNEYEIKEYFKCQDIFYFLKNYCLLKNNEIFEIKNYHKKLIFKFSNYRLNKIAICRQSGMTTLLFCYILHNILFEKNYSILFIGNNFEIFINIYKKLPFFLKIGISRYKRNNIEFENGNKIIIKSNISECLGFSPNLLIIDDLDFKNNLNNLNNLILSIYSRKNDKIILSSCFKKENSFFHKMIKNSIKKLNNFEPTLINFYDVYDNNSDWVFNKIKEIGFDDFNREYILFKDSLKIKRSIKLKNLEIFS